MSEDKKKIQEYIDKGGKVKQIDKVGGSAPKQVQRSRSAEKLTDGVKHKLSTGEGAAVRDRKYGQELDANRKLKEAQEKVKDATKAKEVIRVPRDKNTPAPTLDRPKKRK